LSSPVDPRGAPWELLRGAPSRGTYDGSLGAPKMLNIGAPLGTP